LQDFTVTIETDPSPQDIKALGDGLTEHALPTTGGPGFLPLAVFARDADGRMAGGISAFVNWNWLQIALVWISPERRHTGLGSQLLSRIESAGKERGCKYAHLDTFSYQARPFYERHGYELFAMLDDYPAGHRRYFLRKTL
jgi:GNAT superfamily N-acetyltransferase